MQDAIATFSKRNLQEIEKGSKTAKPHAFFTRFEPPKHPTQIHAASLPRNYTVTALAQNRCFCKLRDSSKNASDFKHYRRPKIDGKSQEDEGNVFSLRHTIFEILCLRNSRISYWDRSELKITFVVKHQDGCFITSNSKTSIWVFTLPTIANHSLVLIVWQYDTTFALRHDCQLFLCVKVPTPDWRLITITIILPFDQATSSNGRRCPTTWLQGHFHRTAVLRPLVNQLLGVGRYRHLTVLAVPLNILNTHRIIRWDCCCWGCKKAIYSILLNGVIFLIFKYKRCKNAFETSGTFADWGRKSILKKMHKDIFFLRFSSPHPICHKDEVSNKNGMKSTLNQDAKCWRFGASPGGSRGKPIMRVPSLGGGSNRRTHNTFSQKKQEKLLLKNGSGGSLLLTVWKFTFQIPSTVQPVWRGASNAHLAGLRDLADLRQNALVLLLNTTLSGTHCLCWNAGDMNETFGWDITL